MISRHQIINTWAHIMAQNQSNFNTTEIYTSWKYEEIREKSLHARGRKIAKIIILQDIFRRLRAHKVKEHKETNSPIPQVDGISKYEDVLKPTYCRICPECQYEIETSENISYHVINDHETKQVWRNMVQFGKITFHLHHIKPFWVMVVFFANHLYS